MDNIEKLTLDIKIGQMILAGFSSKYYDENIQEIIETKKIGNVILFTDNVGSKNEIVALTSRLQDNLIKYTGIPGFIAIDQEGGMVTRIYNDSTFFPGNMAFAAANIKESTLDEGRIEGAELRALGINMNLAPVMDVNCNPENPVIGARSYGDDPQKVAELGIELVNGLKESSVIAVAKHFPGHGDTDIDSHISLPIVNHSMERLEKGLIITDCMEMGSIAAYYTSEKAAVMAIKAGADLICISHSKDVEIKCADAIKEAVLSGVIKEDRIDYSVRKILSIKSKYNLFKNSYPNIEQVLTIVGCEKSKEFAEQISDKSITLIKDEKNLLPVSGNIVSISTKAIPLTGVDGKIKINTSFCERVKLKLVGETFLVALEPEAKLIEKIVISCRNAEKVIIGTYNASSHKGQIDLINRISEVNSNIIVVSLRNPYDILKIKNVSTYINAYEYTELSVKSSIKVIMGEIKPLGISPVKVQL